jgi:hypothetical protein
MRGAAQACAVASNSSCMKQGWRLRSLEFVANSYWSIAQSVAQTAVTEMPKSGSASVLLPAIRVPHLKARSEWVNCGIQLDD